MNERLATLSNRERQVLEGLVAGKPNKIIAFDYDISPRTVEIYRANVMTKMQAASLSELVRMAMIAGILRRRCQAERLLILPISAVGLRHQALELGQGHSGLRSVSLLFGLFLRRLKRAGTMARHSDMALIKSTRYRGR